MSHVNAKDLAGRAALVVPALTEGDRRLLDDACRQAVINVYGPWLTAGRVIPPGERKSAERRVMACRAELARTRHALSSSTVVMVGGGCG